MTLKSSEKADFQDGLYFSGTACIITALQKNYGASRQFIKYEKEEIFSRNTHHAWIV
jgi:hypothetical protein